MAVGAMIPFAFWTSPVTLGFDIVGLMPDTTYTVTVHPTAKDLPGTPGGKPLDGDKDGIGGDPYMFSFTVPPGS